MPLPSKHSHHSMNMPINRYTTTRTSKGRPRKEDSKGASTVQYKSISNQAMVRHPLPRLAGDGAEVEQSLRRAEIRRQLSRNSVSSRLRAAFPWVLIGHWSLRWGRDGVLPGSRGNAPRSKRSALSTSTATMRASAWR